MKLCAVIGLMDTGSSQFIIQLWETLAYLGITSSMLDIEGNKPHISFALYSCYDLACMKEIASSFVPDTKKMSASLCYTGFFSHAAVTAFLGAAVSEELLHFHRMLHNAFAHCGCQPNKLYMPDLWVPHCTLAADLATDKLAQLSACTAEIALPREIIIDRLAVTEFDPVQKTWAYEHDYQLK